MKYSAEAIFNSLNDMIEHNKHDVVFYDDIVALKQQVGEHFSWLECYLVLSLIRFYVTNKKVFVVKQSARFVNFKMAILNAHREDCLNSLNDLNSFAIALKKIIEQDINKEEFEFFILRSFFSFEAVFYTRANFFSSKTLFSLVEKRDCLPIDIKEQFKLALTFLFTNMLCKTFLTLAFPASFQSSSFPKDHFSISLPFFISPLKQDITLFDDVSKSFSFKKLKNCFFTNPSKTETGDISNRLTTLNNYLYCGILNQLFKEVYQGQVRLPAHLLSTLLHSRKEYLQGIKDHLSLFTSLPFRIESCFCFFLSERNVSVDFNAVISNWKTLIDKTAELTLSYIDLLQAGNLKVLPYKKEKSVKGATLKQFKYCFPNLKVVRDRGIVNLDFIKALVKGNEKLLLTTEASFWKQQQNNEINFIFRDYQFLLNQIKANSIFIELLALAKVVQYLKFNLREIGNFIVNIENLFQMKKHIQNNYLPKINSDSYWLTFCQLLVNFLDFIPYSLSVSEEPNAAFYLKLEKGEFSKDIPELSVATELFNLSFLRQFFNNKPIRLINFHSFRKENFHRISPHFLIQGRELVMNFIAKQELERVKLHLSNTYDTDEAGILIKLIELVENSSLIDACSLLLSRYQQEIKNISLACLANNVHRESKILEHLHRFLHLYLQTPLISERRTSSISSKELEDLLSQARKGAYCFLEKQLSATKITKAIEKEKEWISQKAIISFNGKK